MKRSATAILPPPHFVLINKTLLHTGLSDRIDIIKVIVRLLGVVGNGYVVLFLNHLNHKRKDVQKLDR